MQTTMFGAPPATNGFRDSSFAKNKNLPLHRWVPWIAGFSADFVDDALDRYLPKKNGNCWVLDPFAGVGTTLVESYLAGLNVLGFEINPYAALATRIKLNAMRISIHDLTSRIAAFERFMERAENGRLKREPRSQPPTGFSGRTQLFSPKVQRKVLYALDFIDSIEDSTLRDIFRLGLGSVMVSFSNYSYEPSLTRRVAVGKANIEDANVGLSVSAKLHLMLEDIGWVQGHMKRLAYRPRVKVFSKSVFSALECVDQRNFVGRARSGRQRHRCGPERVANCLARPCLRRWSSNHHRLSFVCGDSRCGDVHESQRPLTANPPQRQDWGK